MYVKNILFVWCSHWVKPKLVALLYRFNSNLYRPCMLGRKRVEARKVTLKNLNWISLFDQTSYFPLKSLCLYIYKSRVKQRLDKRIIEIRSGLKLGSARKEIRLVSNSTFHSNVWMKGEISNSRWPQPLDKFKLIWVRKVVGIWKPKLNFFAQDSTFMVYDLW